MLANKVKFLTVVNVTTTHHKYAECWLLMMCITCCCIDKHEFGYGFVVNKRLRHFISGFRPVHELIVTFRMSAKFHNICQDDVVKNTLYAKLEDV